MNFLLLIPAFIVAADRRRGLSGHRHCARPAEFSPPGS
jgi:hypothetical protein